MSVRSVRLVQLLRYDPPVLPSRTELGHERRRLDVRVVRALLPLLEQVTARAEPLQGFELGPLPRRHLQVVGEIQRLPIRGSAHERPPALDLQVVDRVVQPDFLVEREVQDAAPVLPAGLTGVGVLPAPWGQQGRDPIYRRGRLPDLDALYLDGRIVYAEEADLERVGQRVGEHRDALLELDRGDVAQLGNGDVDEVADVGCDERGQTRVVDVPRDGPLELNSSSDVTPPTRSLAPFAATSQPPVRWATRLAACACRLSRGRAPSRCASRSTASPGLPCKHTSVGSLPRYGSWTTDVVWPGDGSHVRERHLVGPCPNELLATQASDLIGEELARDGHGVPVLGAPDLRGLD